MEFGSGEQQGTPEGVGRPNLGSLSETSFILLFQSEDRSGLRQERQHSVQQSLCAQHHRNAGAGMTWTGLKAPQSLRPQTSGS